MSEVKCGDCLATIKSRDKAVISCILCDGKYHIKCVNIKDEEIKCIQDNKNLKFICNYCNSNNLITHYRELKRMMELMDVCSTTIEKHNSIIEEQGKKIDALINVDKPAHGGTIKDKLTYANIAKKSTKEAVLIKPINEDQKSNVTQEEITEKIDPSKLGLRIENIKNISKGGIIVNCSNADTKNKLKNKMEEELGNKYKIEDAKMKTPKIKIKGTELKFINRDDKAILQDIVEQNEIREEGKIRIIRKYEKKGKRNYGIIIAEVEPQLFNDIIQRGKVNAGWRECTVEEHFGIMQCFKCAQFNHLAKDCKNNITCFKCSGTHKTEICNEDVKKCINCITTTEKLKIKLDYNHAAFDLKCPCLSRQIERIVSRTNYST